MLDVALRDRGSRCLGSEFERWIPGFDYWVVEDTLGEFGRRVRSLTGELQPRGKMVRGIIRILGNVQALVGTIERSTLALRE